MVNNGIGAVGSNTNYYGKKIEEKTNKIYSAKNIKRLDIGIEYPWEKKNYDKSDITCKIDTYWYDPIEFEKKIRLYLTYIIPIIKEIVSCDI